MENVIVEISRFVIIFLMTIYTFYGFTALRKKNIKKQLYLCRVQRMLILAFHFVCNLVLYMNTVNLKILTFYLMQLAFLIGFSILYPICYKGISRTLLNHMLMLFSISFIMLERLSFDSAQRQFTMACIAMGIGLVIPVVIRKMKFLMNLQWLYAVLGLGMLVCVSLFGVTQYGAKNWLFIGGISIQPSEFVKILFVFFVASALSRAKQFRQIVYISALAAAHVLILVVQRDLGAALIFFITYVVMLYIATGQSLYLFGGLAGASAASVIAYQLFGHVRVRVSAWLNPWEQVDAVGYQVAQSLFAIGTGGWFGLGLGKGLPTSIPVGKSDFIFSAIAEEFGGIFALWVMLIYVTCFVMFITIALKAKEVFYKLVALGFSVMFIVQVFLCIGGVTRFVPSTGVTMPLVSYGRSSVLGTTIIFSILQGIYLMNQSEEGKIERDKRKVRGTSRRQSNPTIKEVED